MIREFLSRREIQNITEKKTQLFFVEALTRRRGH